MTTFTLKLAQLFQSRTFWTIVVLLIGNILNVKYGLVSSNVSVIANLVLGTVASYFHINPSQDYTLTSSSFVPASSITVPAATNTADTAQ